MDDLLISFRTIEKRHERECVSLLLHLRLDPFGKYILVRKIALVLIGEIDPARDRGIDLVRTHLCLVMIDLDGHIMHVDDEARFALRLKKRLIQPIDEPFLGHLIAIVPVGHLRMRILHLNVEVDHLASERFDNLVAKGFERSLVERANRLDIIPRELGCQTCEEPTIASPDFIGGFGVGSWIECCTYKRRVHRPAITRRERFFIGYLLLKRFVALLLFFGALRGLFVSAEDYRIAVEAWFVFLRDERGCFFGRFSRKINVSYAHALVDAIHRGERINASRNHDHHNHHQRDRKRLALRPQPGASASESSEHARSSRRA